MYNRYIGNTGRVSRIDDSAHTLSSAPRKNPPQRSNPAPQQPREEKKQENAVRRAPLPAPQCQRPPSPLSGLSGIASEIMKKLSPGAFETEDILLILILWLLYKESGDEELLFAMIALFLL